LIFELGIKIMTTLIISPIINGIPSTTVNSACNLKEIYSVMMKQPASETIPVYLSKETAVSTMALDSINGAE
jgi:hypothetical protein